MKRPVYIAGDNIVTSLGMTTAEVMDKVESGFTGFQIHHDPSLAQTPLPLSMVNAAFLSAKFHEILLVLHPEMHAEQFTRLEKMLIVSIQDAIYSKNAEFTGKNTLLIVSTTKGNIDLLGEDKKTFTDPGRIYLWKMAEVIGSFFGFAERPLVVSNACISGVLALSMASRMIEAGLYDHVIVSGGDILSEFVISGFLSFQALSPEPCKPFDIKRNGLSLGEGCGTILLSSEFKKNIPIRISGSSMSNDANHISGPSKTGEELAMAILHALNEAEMKPADVDFVSAHGTATPYNDEMESKALGIAGLQSVPVNSFKGYWGHTLGAAGVVESIATIRSMEKNLLIRSAGFDESGVPVPVNVIRENTLSPVQNSLKIASGFGGCNAAIVFRKLD
ncbi:MAG: beta-ketoacyl synthase N-terminal-like domain-containing protein [Bacteroidetes bacterium]|nr:beta-ketoacyl synthase N-terminal-like domain-containing protein [Bacteroidota bacterium]